MLENMLDCIMDDVFAVAKWLNEITRPTDASVEKQGEQKPQNPNQIPGTTKGASNELH